MEKSKITFASFEITQDNTFWRCCLPLPTQSYLTTKPPPGWKRATQKRWRQFWENRWRSARQLLLRITHATVWGALVFLCDGNRRDVEVMGSVDQLVGERHCWWVNDVTEWGRECVRRLNQKLRVTPSWHRMRLCSDSDRRGDRSPF